jgi:Protein of unknown function (DUF4240)
MDADEFWRLIDEARAECDPEDADGEKIAANAVDLLARLPPEEILDAHRLLKDRLTGSYVAPLWAAGYVANGGCSDDMFEYFRGWLLTRGREVFDRAMADPDSLADHPAVRAAARTGWDLECETALGITRAAYERAAGGPLPAGVWQGSYPDLGGDHWFDYRDGARLARLLPRLTALYSAEA